MPWYRVEDRTAGQVALVDAHTPEDAVEEYLEEYPPDLMVEEASAAEIEEWREFTDNPDNDMVAWSI